MKKKVHYLPNVITAFGLTCGLFVIFKMNMTGLGEATERVLSFTAGILLLAVFADLLDGWTARVINAESEFGGLFDSLADAITFAVGPSVIVLKTFSLAPGTAGSFLMTAAVMVFSVSGVLRLVRFNVQAMHAKGNEEMQQANKKNFTGLPIPAAAMSLVSANLFFVSEDFARLFTLGQELRAGLMFFTALCLGYLMVCRLKFPSLKSLQIRVSSFRFIFLIVFTAVIIFYGIMHYFAVVFFLVSWLYVLAALTLSFIRIVWGKRAKTLEEFEPESEEELEWGE